ncbi:MAG: cell division protein FtsQ/DivIB [Planctomycetota bacterium]
MARRKKTKSKTKRISFKYASSRRKRKRRVGRHSRGLKVAFVTTLIALAMACLCAAVGAAFVLLDRYVEKAVSASERIGSLELVGVPSWLNEELKEKIYTAAGAYSRGLQPDEDAARLVQSNLAREVVWLDQVRVQTTHDSIRINGRWRKPLALVKSGLRKFYVDAELVVLDFVPMLDLPIVEVKGLSIVPNVPSPGKVWGQDDLAAAITILDRLDRMDKIVTADKPLLYEIDSINVSNFNGRQNSREPHIRLCTKDNIEIIWGAEYGKWQRYLEVPDEEKLAKLYSYYKEYGSLRGAKYINLCDPQDHIPLPIDKY